MSSNVGHQLPFLPHSKQKPDRKLQPVPRDKRIMTAGMNEGTSQLKEEQRGNARPSSQRLCHTTEHPSACPSRMWAGVTDLRPPWKTRSPKLREEARRDLARAPVTCFRSARCGLWEAGALPAPPPAPIRGPPQPARSSRKRGCSPGPRVSALSLAKRQAPRSSPGADLRGPGRAQPGTKK